MRTLWPDIVLKQTLAPIADKPEPAEEVLRRAVHAWMCMLGPATSADLGQRLRVAPAEIWKQMLRLEVAGTLMRGTFEGRGPVTDDVDLEWCERRLLQRIHKRTLGALRKQVEPVTAAAYMQWLLGWQHVAPQTQLAGEQGLLEALRGLEGFEAPAIEWERSILPARVADYDPRWLDALSLTGVLGWGRLSPHPAFYAADSGGPRRVVPTSMAPITFFLREEALWMDLCLSQRQIPETNLACCLSDLAVRLRGLLQDKGAMFAGDFTRTLAAPAAEVTRALWELVAAGLVTADGFDSLRMLVDPRRKQTHTSPAGARRGAPRNTAGRWSLLASPEPVHTPSAGERAEQHEAQIASACKTLLRRYGVLFRDVLLRESTIPRWRELLPMLRRMEARGEVRGGRFLFGFGGEQFAPPEALDSLRAAGREQKVTASVTVSAADPLNLFGIVIPGERVTAITGRTVTYDESSFLGVKPAQPTASQSIIFPTHQQELRPEL